MEAALRRATVPKGNVAEFELFDLLRQGARRLGTDWPSILRNTVNYRPGAAYDTVRGRDALAYSKVVKPPGSRALQTIVDLYRDALAGLGKPAADFSATPPRYAALLVGFAFLIDAVATDLHADMSDRHSLAKDWKRRRQLYLLRHASGPDGAAWPIAGAG
jgi:hypothetical protein